MEYKDVLEDVLVVVRRVQNAPTGPVRLGNRCGACGHRSQYHTPGFERPLSPVCEGFEPIKCMRLKK